MSKHLIMALLFGLCWLPAAIFAGGSVYLAVQGIGGWGWFMAATFIWGVFAQSLELEMK